MLHKAWIILSDLKWALFLLIYSVVLTLQSEWIFRMNAPQTFYFALHHPIQFWNETLFIFLIAAILFLLLRSPFLTVLASGGMFSAFSIANYIKTSTRSEPLLPWDFKVIKDAAEISNRVKVHITMQILVSCAVLLVFALLLLLLRKRIPPLRLHLAVRSGAVVAMAVGLVLLTAFVFINDKYLALHNIKEITWSQLDNYKQNGCVFSFLNNLGHSSVVKPANYSANVVENAASKIKRQPASTQKPNIIMIQDEAFCDLTRFKNVKYSEDIMPTITGLKQNCFSGYALTPMYGGGTCNSEFEVLTGFTYSYLPNGSTPYEEYFKSPTFSYADFLKNQGYSTIAVHPFDPTFWCRNTVFPNIGFDKFYSEDSFVNPERKRGFISDLETMKMIVKQYEDNKQTGKPYFNFTITMQNHYSWGKDDYPESERVKLNVPGLTGEEKDILTTYSTGAKEADAALGYLISYFSKVEEPTIIVFYGDHMPAFDMNTLTAGGYLSGKGNAQDMQMMHSTPYVMWNNFEQKKGSADMSMYELVPYMTKSFNIQRPLYFDYLLDQYNTFQGYATGVYIDKSNTPTMKQPKSASSYISEQHLFEYDLLIGNKYGTVLTK